MADTLGLRHMARVQRRVLSVKTSAAPGGGTQVLTSDEPGAEENWVVTTAAAVNRTATRSNIYLELLRLGTATFISGSPAPAALVGHSHTGWIVLRPADTIRATFLATAAGDSLELVLYGWGYLVEE